jgi:tetratricopeptide (TPR) repeat protein
MRFVFVALCGLLFVCSSALADGREETKEKWYEATSPNFVLVTNSGASRAEALLEQAERFRFALGRVLPRLRLSTAAPTLVYGFRDFESLSPFLPDEEEAGTNVTGYFRTGRAGHAIVVDLSLGSREYERVLYHEYVHLVVSLGERRVPLWFEEGLSEFYAGTRVGRDAAEVGSLETRHVNALLGRKLLPLDEVLAASEGSSWSTDPETAGLFYAESWALVHYLLTKAPAGQERLARFLALSSDGRDPVESFLHVFGEEPREMEQTLVRYVRRADLSAIHVPLPPVVEERRPRSRLLSRAEIQNRWGQLFVATGRPKEAKVCLHEALRLDPTLAGPYETLGFLSLAEGDRKGALERFQRAAELDGASASGLTAYAKTLLTPYAGSWVEQVPDDVAERAVPALRRSLALEPGAREPSELLAFVYLVRGERLDEAEGLLASALAVAPEESALLYLRGQLLAKRGLYEDAREVLRRVAEEASDPRLRSAAREFLERMGAVEKAPRK